MLKKGGENLLYTWEYLASKSTSFAWIVALEKYSDGGQFKEAEQNNSKLHA